MLASKPMKIMAVYYHPPDSYFFRPVCLPWRRASRPGGGCLGRQARGLELKTGYDMRHNLA